jgi:DNA-binding Xre family transcriptional regulator
MSIATKLKDARIKADLCLNRVASLTNIRVDVLIDLEAGVKPIQTGTLDMLCQLYGVNPHDLLRTADMLTFREAMHALHMGNDLPFRQLMERN